MKWAIVFCSLLSATVPISGAVALTYRGSTHWQDSDYIYSMLSSDEVIEGKYWESKSRLVSLNSCGFALLKVSEPETLGVDAEVTLAGTNTFVSEDLNGGPGGELPVCTGSVPLTVPPGVYSMGSVSGLNYRVVVGQPRFRLQLVYQEMRIRKAKSNKCGWGRLKKDPSYVGYSRKNQQTLSYFNLNQGQTASAPPYCRKVGVSYFPYVPLNWVN